MSFLKETAKFEGSIDVDSVVCPKCTFFLHSVLRAKDASTSAKEVLHGLEEKLQELKLSLLGVATVGTETTNLQVALTKTTVYLAELLLGDKCITFPQIYRKFCLFLLIGSTPPSKCRVLSLVGSEVGEFMSSFCHHKKIGRVFYRTGADPFVLLSHAVGQANQRDGEQSALPLSSPVRSAVDSLNNKLHQLADKLIKCRKDDPLCASKFDLESFVESVDLELWEGIVQLTKSVSEVRGRTVPVATSLSAHVKKVRHAYLLCVALFITNPQCSVPLHILLADVVEACGGSDSLISILYRIGAVASFDTLKRHICEVSVQHRRRGC